MNWSDSTSSYSYHTSPVHGYKCLHPGGHKTLTEAVWRVSVREPARLFLYGATCDAITSITHDGDVKQLAPPTSKGVRGLGPCSRGVLVIRFDDAAFERWREVPLGVFFEAQVGGVGCILGGSAKSEWDPTVPYDPRSEDELKTEFVDSNMAHWKVRQSREPFMARSVPCPAILARG